MALSNIFREPRREITETVIGVLTIVPITWLDYQFAVWFHKVSGGDEHGCPLILGMFFGVFVAIAFISFVFFIHTIGEVVCDKLCDRGLELRPKQRR